MADKIFTLTISNSLSELERIADKISECGAANDWPPRWTFEINLALDELVTNTINYGYTDSDKHQIEITARVVDQQLVVTVEDDAIAFNPFTDAPAPDLDADVEARAVGGLGVHLVRELIDAVNYERRGERNFITLTQNYSAKDEKSK